jgi:hypothetical protein
MMHFLQKLSSKIISPKGKIIFVLGTSTLSGIFLFLILNSFSPAPVLKLEKLSPKSALPEVVIPEEPKTPHIATPVPVRGIYISSWVSSLKERREGLVKFIEATELNAVVIDIKDFSGLVLFDTQDPEIKKLGVEENRIPDLREWIQELHSRGIYVIARLTVFQDPLYANKFPEQAVQTLDGKVWKDRKGLSFVDVSSKPFWDHILRIAKAAEKAGFDEINYDYIRFPSDGNMKNIKFPLSGPDASKKDVRLFSHQHQLAVAGKTVTVNINGQPTSVPTIDRTLLISARQQRLEAFFKYIHEGMKEIGIPSSADVFGMVATNRDDLGIGQVLESTLPYFDYVCPMVYPSHYPRGFRGIQNPAANPYQIIHFSMLRATERAKEMKINPLKLRPWIQDFDMGASYNAAEILAQKKAIYDTGLDSFLVWDPRNAYTRAGYTPSQNETPLIVKNP